jgi:hypothetical protein
MKRSRMFGCEALASAPVPSVGGADRYNRDVVCGADTPLRGGPGVYEAGSSEVSPRWQRDWRRLSLAFVAGAVLSAVVTVVVVDTVRADNHVVTSAGAQSSTTLSSLPLVTAPTPVPSHATTLPATTIAPPVSQQSSKPISGTVTDTNGHPVGGAYVIGLDSLTVVRADSAGRFSLPCQVTANAMTANRTEALVAGSWLLPIQPIGRGGYGYGQDTTKYPPPPTTPGLGYAFSGGAADAAHAKVVTCDGQPVNFVLPPGGGVDVQFVDTAGRPARTFPGPPVDNLYLPGLGDHAALETAPLTNDGHQIIDQLGPGSLNLDILYPMACTETAGPQSGPLNGSDVTITPGRTAYVTCRETTSASNTGSPAGQPPSP